MSGVERNRSVSGKSREYFARTRTVRVATPLIIVKSSYNVSDYGVNALSNAACFILKQEIAP